MHASVRNAQDCSYLNGVVYCLFFEKEQNNMLESSLLLDEL